MKKFLVALLVVLGALSAVTVQAKDLSAEDVVGMYQCEGTNPEGKPYKGMVEVVALPTGVVYARWTFADSDEQAFGVGLVRRGLLILSYYGTAAGTAVYVLPDAGPIDGEWTAAGDRGVYRERLIKLPEGHPAPTPGRQRPPSRHKHEIQG